MNYQDLFLKSKWYGSRFLDWLAYDKLNFPKPEYTVVPIDSINIVWGKEKGGDYFAYAPLYNAIYTATKDPNQLVFSINDAIYTYFNIPDYYARKMGNKFIPPAEAWAKVINGKTVKTNLPILAGV